MSFNKRIPHSLTIEEIIRRLEAAGYVEGTDPQDVWARMCRVVLPEEYGEPPQLTERDEALPGSELRIECYRQRVERGYQVFSRQDRTHSDTLRPPEEQPRYQAERETKPISLKPAERRPSRARKPPSSPVLIRRIPIQLYLYTPDGDAAPYLRHL